MKEQNFFPVPVCERTEHIIVSLTVSKNKTCYCQSHCVKEQNIIIVNHSVSGKETSRICSLSVSKNETLSVSV